MFMLIFECILLTPGGRLSYTFGFRGPSVSIDTACSSSLVATHMISTQLITGVSEGGISCGVGILLSPHPTAMFQKVAILQSIPVHDI